MMRRPELPCVLLTTYLGLAAVRSIEIRGSRRLAPDAGFVDRVILAPPFQASGAAGQR